MAQAMGPHEGTEQPRKGRKKRYLLRPLRGYFNTIVEIPQLALWANF
jgi:hypothetical protein